MSVPLTGLNPQSFCHTQNTSQSLPWPGGMDCVSWLLATSSKFTPIAPSAATWAFLHMLEHTEYPHPRTVALAATSPWITLSPFIPVSHSLTLHSGLYPNDIASKRSSGATPFLLLFFFNSTYHNLTYYMCLFICNIASLPLKCKL